MHNLAPSSIHDREDTKRFLATVDRAMADIPSPYFDPTAPVFVSRAPGRLDLIGGIADYSGSLVLELPIDAATHVALQRVAEPTVEIVSLSSEGGDARRFVAPLGEILVDDGSPDHRAAREYFRASGEAWAGYVAGAFPVLARERRVAFEGGARMLIASDVPEGKGVSSSASLEIAAMQAIAAAYAVDVSPQELAFLSQRVENFVAGAPCGVMDQMTAACGEAGRLLAILCQPGDLQGSIALPDELAVWGVDSGVRHSVGGGDYGTVRAAAFMGYRIIADLAGLEWRPVGDGKVEVDDPKWGGYLANLDTDEFESRYEPALPESLDGAEFLARYGGITDSATRVDPGRAYPVRAATAHPVRENARVHAFAEILDAWPGLEAARDLGLLMYAAHESYSSCGLGSPETDLLVEMVKADGGRSLYGAKITGGGSGGTVAILGHRDAGEAVASLVAQYEARAERRALVISGSSPGARAFGVLRLDAPR
jgi:L-arabinokinase